MMQDLEKARQDGVIKHVDDLKLSNENKKIVNKELLFDEFYEGDPENSLFAVVNVGKIDKDLMLERIKAGKYLFNPLKRSFTSTVKIMALVILAAFKFKEKLLRKQIERKEKK